VREFEGYLFYLEVENSQQFLEELLFEQYVLLFFKKREIIIRKRDGPITVLVAKFSGKRYFFP
jgi:hypothetical protein